jgi:hypothetical protein
MTRASLREVFRRALQASVVAPIALAACAPDTTNYVAPTCENGLLSVRGLSPSVIPDVTQFRQFNAFGGPSERDAGTVNTLSTDGEVCKTATDKPACTTAFDALRPATGFGAECFQLCVDYHLATSKGDTVAAVASLESLKAFLGPIDTAQEAMLIAFANGYRINCDAIDRGAAKKNGSAWDVLAEKGIACGPGTAITRHYLTIGSDGTLTENRAEIVQRGMDNCAIGRRPPGLTSSGVSGCDEVLGRYFAEAAHLEAASVPAFEQLFAELESFDAPVALRRAALIAALEEIDHTHRTATLARRFGAQVVVPEVDARPLRSMKALAIDNAVEGCVRETFGALVAQHQALTAQDEGIRAAMQVIAEDETRHAELSWELDAWLCAGLNEQERAEVEVARRSAVEQLRVGLEAPVDEQLTTLAGVPSRETTLRLFQELQAA